MCLKSVCVFAYVVATISRLLKIIGLFAEYSLFDRDLLQKRPTILRILLIIATPYQCVCGVFFIGTKNGGEETRKRQAREYTAVSHRYECIMSHI